MTFTTALTAPPRGDFRRNRLLQALVLLYFAIWIAMAISPVDRHDWLLENLLAIALVTVLIATYRRFPFSDLSYVFITAFLVLHAIGAHYTYSKVPIGFWIKEVFHLERNHFDRIVHLAYGVLLFYPARELFLRAGGAKRGWAAMIALLAVIATSGLFEVIEAWVAQIVNPDLGAAYLGTQGDEWDAQKDMTMAVIGAIVTTLVTQAVPKAEI
jgi:putative membrane protein